MKMKRFISILIFLFCFHFGDAQQFPVKQLMGSPNTDVHSRGAFSSDSGYVYTTSYADTSEMNNGFLKNIPGIVLRSGDALWIRNTTTNAWIQVGTALEFENGLTESGGVVKLGGTLTGNTAIDGEGLNFYLEDVGAFRIYGTGSYVGERLIETEGVSGVVRIGRLGIDRAFSVSDSIRITGLGKSLDTTSYKIAVLNESTGAMAYADWVTAVTTVSASNGLSASAGDVKLGGTLDENTTITAHHYPLA